MKLSELYHHHVIMKKNSFEGLLSHKRIRISAILISVILSGCTSGTDNQASQKRNPDTGGKRWYRGNTHTHAKFSDGKDNNDVPVIAGWYKNAGYDFLVLSEHNNHLFKKRIFCHDEAAVPPDFIMICGLELSRKQHITALGINSFISDESSLEDGVNKTIAAGGIPILNHPQVPITKYTDFIKMKGLNHFEVFNGNRPEQTPASESLWDKVLSAPDGRLVFAVASDDNHYRKSKVGRGWIMVKSAALTKDDIVENIRKGNFYASTGVMLKDYQVTESTISVISENGNTITFIGRDGIILSSVNDSKATYQINGNELYIRAKITNRAGEMAWIQPVFVK
jgi:hypothetical protein